MPFNLSGTLAAFHALVRPRLLIPNLIVHDVSELNFAALRKAGYQGAILDKDNCLTLPNRDALVPDLQVAWEELKNEFGPRNLLIVSNSAGTRSDAGGLAAESVSHNLGVPVLRHSSLKPSYRTITAIQRYFSSLPSSITDHRELVVIGDRVLTDTILANRMGAFSILVTRDWTRTLKSHVTGSIERMGIRLARRWTATESSTSETSGFLKEVHNSRDEVKLGYTGSTWTWTGRALGWGPNSGKRS